MGERHRSLVLSSPISANDSHGVWVFFVFTCNDYLEYNVPEGIIFLECFFGKKPHHDSSDSGKHEAAIHFSWKSLYNNYLLLDDYKC